MQIIRRANLMILCGLAAVGGLESVARSQQTAGAPANDNCRDSIIVTDESVNFSTVGATLDGEEEFQPPSCNVFGYANIDKDIWYRYTATCTGDLSLNLCNSNFDTKVAVYAGCVCPVESPPLECNDDGDCEPQSQLTVPVQEGECYTIRLGGFQLQSGTGVMVVDCNVIVPLGACCNTLGNCLGTMSQSDCQAAGGIWHDGQNCSTFTCPIPPPPNDLCSNAIPLDTGEPFSGTTLGATGTDATPACATQDTKDVWHRWTATCSGRVRIRACESSFDTSLAVYPACGGGMIVCNDDACGTNFTRSQVELTVQQGSTYFVRIAGSEGITGNYSVIIDTCRNACCIDGGAICQNILTEQCLGGGGMPAGPGTVCLQDNNGNGVDDVCENTCPAAQILDAAPPDGTLDARQPHAMNNTLPRQGLGSAPGAGVIGEPIVITLTPAVAGAENCFSLCENAVDPLLGPNSILTVNDQGGGVYEIFLAHAIKAGAVTTISYGGSQVRYTAHPGNVNGDSAAGPSDILELIDHLNGALIPPLTTYQCDLDRSQLCTPSDILTEIDLLNGSGQWDPWNGTSRPANAACP